MKTLDAIKKLNAVKKEDGELLLATPIDMKVLKGAKEQELAEAYMSAVETISDEDVDKYLPDDLSDIYNAFSDAEKTRTAETTLEKKPEKTPEKSAKEAPVKKEEKKTEKKVDKKSEKSAAKVAEKKSEVKKFNKYGHREGSGGCLIDTAFEKGGTFESIAKQLGLTVGRIKSHYMQLKNLKKISFIVDEKKGSYKIK